ncbi:MAG: hypothetical protein ABSB38_03615 [Dehalococcoidia bacterium]
MVVKNKQDAARVLADVTGDKRFFCEDGCVSANLTELVNCLNYMTEATFNHHVTSWKNDFSTWIRNVLGDDKLAGDLTKVNNPIEAAKVATQRVAWLQKKSK